LATVLFVLGIIIVLFGVAGVWAVHREGESAGLMAGAVAAVVIGLSMVIGSMWTTVDARSVGVQTSFGKYRDTLGPGFTWTAPWSDVEEFTTRNQTMRFAGDGRAEDRDNYTSEPFLTVRLGNQSEAYVDATVTWRITEGSIKGLWEQYKTFDAIRSDFATPQVMGATQSVFDGYDPFRGLSAANVDNPYVSVEEWSKRVTDKLRAYYAARGIELVSVQVTKVAYDKRTEDKLREYADAVANTRIKAQDVETAKREAEASAARRATSGTDCISLIRDLAAQDQLKNLAPGTNVCGGAGSPVIVGGR